MFTKTRTGVFTLTTLLLLIFNSFCYAEGNNFFTINNHCIGKVCIGDTLETIKTNYSSYIIKVNDSKTGYYIFDELGNFLIEFSSKQTPDNTDAPVRYIMTSNPNFTYKPGDIDLESTIEDLMCLYGKPRYETGPNGYHVEFSKWPIEHETNYNNFKINAIVGIYNPKLSELFNSTGSSNENAEIQLLKNYPDATIINTFELYSDYYVNGNPIK